MRPIRPLLFRIFYSTSFTVVFLLVVSFVAVTPADAIYQAWKSRRLWDIGEIAGTYVLTAILAILVYASRRYTNRSILQSIPKGYIPVEKDDLPDRRTRQEILVGLERSALTAYRARPRFETADADQGLTASARISAITHPAPRDELSTPSWDHISHPGWSSPASPDLPNLHYDTVIAELPDLIEAKAVSLAPLDAKSPPLPDDVLLPNERLVEALQRPFNMGLRDYIFYLDSLRLINPPTLGQAFTSLYERARFSTRPLDEPPFRSLMSIFASILRGMTKLDPGLVAELQGLDPGDDGWRNNGQVDWRTPDAWTPKSASTFSVDDTGSVRHRHPPRRVSEDSVPSLPTDPEGEDEGNYFEAESEDSISLRTAPLQQTRAASSNAPSEPQGRSGTSSRPRRDDMTLRMTSASSGRPLRQTRSDFSLGSRRSTRSGGSVIRLTEARNTDDLPYTIQIPGPRHGGVGHGTGI